MISNTGRAIRLRRRHAQNFRFYSQAGRHKQLDSTQKAKPTVSGHSAKASAGSSSFESDERQNDGTRSQVAHLASASYKTRTLELDWDKLPRPPKGVNLAKFRKKLLAPPANAQLPKLEALIVVEGLNDCFAVHKAVRSPVFVLGGGYALADAMKPELLYLRTLAVTGSLPRELVVFMDPDWQGRMFRTYLDNAWTTPSAPSPPSTSAASVAEGSKGESTWALNGVVVRHAFLRVEQGTSERPGRYHEAGNVGVEHAAPDTIRTCLKRARPGFGLGRSEFSLEELMAAGLIGSFDDKKQVLGPSLRRQRFCGALGVDTVGTGKALANLLNRFFTREEYSAALAACMEPQ